LRIIDYSITVYALSLGFQERYPLSLNLFVQVIIFSIFIFVNIASEKLELNFHLNLLKYTLIIFIFFSIIAIGFNILML